MKTAIINARVKPELKSEVEAILSQLGITTTQAITMFFEQVKMNRGIPFELKIPNAETIEAMEDARADRDMESITIEDLKAQLTK
ncbi:MAG: DNA-damage-inducible protein J [Methyloprofundus sp.]|nr:MAG: DNA-damage-inducible protein J [Methyloprofundus sp.]